MPPGLQEITLILILPVERSRSVMFRYDLLRIVREGFGLREKLETFQYFGIRFRAHLHALILTEGIYENLGLDVGFDPVVVIQQIRLRVGNISLVERFAEILHDGIIDFEALRGVM